jgi:hypothetical protein
LSYIEPISEPPIVKIDPDITFNFYNGNPEQEPVVVIVEVEVIFASDRTEAELDELEATLLSGGDPAFVRTELIVLGNSPHFTCSYLLCPRYLYLLGLASELANDDFSAIAAYLELWRQFPGSPFTTMARFKLGSIYTPTPTPTVTTTPSPTALETQLTPIASATNTPEGYPAPSIVPTNTQPGYPPPNNTPTSTQPGYPAPGTPTSTQPGYPYP